MKILQWNVNGFHRRLENIQRILNDIDPLCICIQETNFKNNYCAKLKNYIHFFKNRSNSSIASGGVATYVKSHTLPKEVDIISPLEVIAIRIEYPLAITICNVYLPNSCPLSENDLNNLKNQLPTPFVLLGDFNSHHFYWGSDHCDLRGKIISDWLDVDENMILLNTNQPTHFNNSNGHTSSIDLAFASRSISTYFDWYALDDLYDSDHYPIMITLKIDLSPENQNAPQHFKYQMAEWPNFRSDIEIKINQLSRVTPESLTRINDLVDEFNQILLGSAEKHIPKTTGKIKKKTSAMVERRV